MQAAVAGHQAGEKIRSLGGDPAVLDALAMLRSEVVEGITLYANPAATYCALRLIAPFYPQPPEDADGDDGGGSLEIDRLAGMAYCFAEPVRAYLFARRGEEDFLMEVMEWLGRAFPAGDSSYRLGRVAGWCAGVLRVLDQLNPRTPGPPTNTQPGTSPVAAPAPLPPRPVPRPDRTPG